MTLASPLTEAPPAPNLPQEVLPAVRAERDPDFIRRALPLTWPLETNR